MTITNFTGAGFTDPNGDYYWNDPQNWDSGTPQYGETAIIDGTGIGIGAQVPVITMGDLGLSGLNIECREVFLKANVLTLSHTSITSFDNIDSSSSALIANDIVVGGSSFVGVAAGQLSGSFDLLSSSIVNYGNIGAESGGGSEVFIQSSGPSLGEFDNNGHIVATGGGVAVIDQEDVFGNGNAVVSQGGILSLAAASLFNNVAMSGASASTFDFDPAVSFFAGTIHGFAVTDFIHLDNFNVTGVSESSLINPMLTLTGTDEGSSMSLNLNFFGNFTHDNFNTAPDAQGTGTLLYVTHG